MAKIKASENYVRMRCAECTRVNYYAHKNKKKVERKLELKRYCKWCRKKTVHKESKK